MSTPTGPPDGAGARPRTVVWTAGEEPGRARRLVGRWLVLLVVAGTTAFVLAYVAHLWLAGAAAPSVPGGPPWLPGRLPGDACASGGRA